MKARLAMLKRKQEKMVKAMVKRQDEWKKQMLVKKSVAEQKAQLLKAQALRDARLLEEKRQRLLAVRKQQERERENQNKDDAKSLRDKKQKEDNKKHIQAVMDHRLGQRRAQRIKVQNNKSSAKKMALKRKRKVRQRQRDEFEMARKLEDEEHSALLVELEKMRQQEAQMMRNLNGLAEMSLTFDDDLKQMEAEIEEKLQNEIAAANRERKKIEERYQELLIEFSTPSSKAGSKAGSKVGSKAGSSAPSPIGFSVTAQSSSSVGLAGDGGGGRGCGGEVEEQEAVATAATVDNEEVEQQDAVDMDLEKLAVFTKSPGGTHLVDRDTLEVRVRRFSSAKQSSVLTAMDSQRKSITLGQALEASKVIPMVAAEADDDLQADPRG